MPWLARVARRARNRTLATWIGEPLLMGLAGWWTFWWGNGQLIYPDHDASNWGLVNLDQFRGGAVWLGAQMSLNQGLGTWNDVHSWVLDVPLALASIPGGLMRESVYGGVAVAILYASGAFLASMAGASRGIARTTGVVLCFATILPSPLVWARVAYSMRAMHLAIALGAVLLGAVIGLTRDAAGGATRVRALLAIGAISGAAIPLVAGAQAPFALAGPVIAALPFLRPALARAWATDRRALVTTLAGMVAVVGPVSVLTVALVRQSAAGSGSPLAVSMAVATARETGEWGWTFDGLSQTYYLYRPLVIAGWLAAIAAGLGASRGRSRLHWSALVTLAAIQAYGIVHTAGVRSGSEVSPRPEYLFLSSIPVLCLVCTATAPIVLASWGRVLRRSRPIHGAARSRRWMSFAALLVVPVWLAQWTVDNRSLRDEPRTFPPQSGPDVARLADAYSLSVNPAFRGRVLFVHDTAQGEGDFGAALAPTIAGGDAHLSTLHGDVPFLGVHSSFQTGQFVEFMSEFFADGASFVRNWTVPTTLDPSITSLAGVATVLAEEPLDELAGVPAESILLGSHRLLRYDLPGANVGDFSPTRVVVEPTRRGAFDRMAAPDFDPRVDVVLEAWTDAALQPATSATLRVGDGRLHVVAASAGTSLLVLPFEYSACAQVSNRSVDMAGDRSEGGEVRIVRANGLFLGVLFSGNLDATIEYRVGLLRSGCLSAS